PEMVCHVSCDLRQGLGELETGPPTEPLAHAPFNWLAIHVVPWPKGKGQSPPEFLATRPTTWQADVSRLRELIRRFSDRGPAAEWPASRVFGRISGRSWGVMLYKHLDHHLRQGRVSEGSGPSLQLESRGKRTPRDRHPRRRRS